MLVRVLLVVGLVLLAHAAAHVAERFRSRGAGTIPAGLTLVVKGGCRECLHAKARLDEIGVPYVEVDVGEADVYGIRSYAVPYAFVGSSRGEALMVRRGQAVASDAAALAEATLAYG